MNKGQREEREKFINSAKSVELAIAKRAEEVLKKEADEIAAGLDGITLPTEDVVTEEVVTEEAVKKVIEPTKKEEEVAKPKSAKKK